MALLPAGMDTFEVTFGAAGVLGRAEDLSIELEFYASTNAIWAETGQPFLRKPQTANAPLGESGSAVLISPDQDGFVNASGNPIKGWTYHAVAHFRDASGQQVDEVEFNFAYLASMGPSIDLDMTVPVTTSAGVVVNLPSGFYSDEMARDAIAAALRGVGGITVTVDDAANTITIAGAGGGGAGGGGYQGGTVYDPTDSGGGTPTPTLLVTNAGDQLITSSGDSLVIS
jgi:hypothetical protein